MTEKHENIIHELADKLLEHFDETGATNYIECTFEDKTNKENSFVLTMQKIEGLTPCQKLQQEQKKCLELQEELKRIKSRNKELMERIDEAYHYLSMDDSEDAEYNAMCALSGGEI